jgi:hypothetical protein
MQKWHKIWKDLYSKKDYEMVKKFYEEFTPQLIQYLEKIVEKKG